MRRRVTSKKKNSSHFHLFNRLQKKKKKERRWRPFFGRNVYHNHDVDYRLFREEIGQLGGTFAREMAKDDGKETYK